jgi:hypothetical protein
LNPAEAGKFRGQVMRRSGAASDRWWLGPTGLPGRPATVGSLRGVPEQLLVRDVNDQIVLGALRSGPVDVTHHFELLCECAARTCVEPIVLSLTEYEAVRRFPARFAIGCGHTVGVDEQVVCESDGHWVVEKHGPSAAAAIRLDPRRRHEILRPAG